MIRRPRSVFLIPLFLASFLAAAAPARAGAPVAIACPDSVAEGEAFILRLQFMAPVREVVVHWLDKSLHRTFEKGAGDREVEILLGLGLHERLPGEEFPLRVEYQTAAGWASLEKSVRRLPKAYPEQHLEVARKYTELSPEDSKRHQREKRAVRAALDRISSKRWDGAPLSRPSHTVVTSDFGLRRFFAGEPKQPHGGVDLRAAVGDTVRACAEGRVILTGDHFFAGKSIYLDHGQGLVSMYFHLSRIDVIEGQRVMRGQAIAAAGDTGRVTASHLHWGISVFGQLVDPMLLVPTAP